MRLKRHSQLLESTVKHVSARPFFASQCNRSRYSTSAAYPEQIAVLGGGIAGLASAYYTAKEFPKSKITIYEAGNDVGGWIRSTHVEVPGGKVLFEHGPRTLRPGSNSLATAGLIQELGLINDVVYTSKDSPAAQNRYVYYPNRLVRMPTNTTNLAELFKLYMTGIADGVPSALFREIFKPPRPPNMTDESMGSFIARRFDKRPAQNVLSAVIHGIYAGDIWQLSARTLLSLMWNLEGLHGGIQRGFWSTNLNSPTQDLVTITHPYDAELRNKLRDEITLEPELRKKLGQCSTFSFKNGLRQLVVRLEETLRKNNQVTIKTNIPVKSFHMAPGGKDQVELVLANNSNNPPKFTADLVISTLHNRALTPYVTVMVVNLYFSTPNLLPVKGFGYLIPQSVPFEQNPERALGVIFDSDAVPDQDSVPGTKLTVMLGGHWWNGWQAYPTHDEGSQLALSVVRRHLGINEEPKATHVTLSRDAIPQYTVGYEERLKQFAEGLVSEFGGRLRVAGNQFNGVGVNDVVTGAWDLVRGCRGEGWKGRSSGLERVMDRRKWVEERLVKVGREKEEEEKGR